MGFPLAYLSRYGDKDVPTFWSLLSWGVGGGDVFCLGFGFRVWGLEFRVEGFGAL